MKCYMEVVGIDLAGVAGRNTGFCVMDNSLCCDVSVLHFDEEIIEAALRCRPDVVAIDAPLALPHGRESLSVPSSIHLRECDRQLKRMGIRFFPLTIGPMRLLTERGIRLKAALEQRGLNVVETYPGAAQDILCIPRKQKGLALLLKGLRGLGLTGLPDDSTGDELDAATCALAGIMLLRGECQTIGDPTEMLMVLPRGLPCSRSGPGSGQP